MGTRYLTFAAALGLMASFGCDQKGDHRMSQNSTDQQNSGQQYSKSQNPGQQSRGQQYTGQRSTGEEDIGKPQELGTADRTFLSNAAMANLAEIETSKVAQERANRPEVKRFAEHMVEDHTAVSKQGMELGRKKGFALPTQVDDAHKKDASRLNELYGADFDKSYMSMMVNDHVKAVSLFEEASKNSQDPEVRDFAVKTLPKLKDHLKMARDVNGQIGGPQGAD